jgi:DNA repair exonuclease SbcCD ATPase subunit
MKKIIFTKITIQNFLSVGTEPVSVDFKRGLHILTGNNKDKPDRQNAVGKSTVADAIYFAIFGETLREIKKDLITNNITGGKTQVELEFNVESPKGNNKFHIVRTLSPTKVSVYKDGVDKTRDSIANTTKYICDVLSASPAIFQNCVIMTVNNTVPFMAKNKIDKRKFIEDIFGMEVFSKMISTLRQEYNDIKRDYDINFAKITEINKTLLNYNNQKQKLLDKKEVKKKLYLERQISNTKELEDLHKELLQEADIQNISDIQITIDKLEEKLTSSDVLINELIGQSSNKKATIIHKKEIYKKMGTEGDSCPVCLRSIQDHDKEHISREKQIIKDDIVSIAKEVEDICAKIQEVEATKIKLKLAIQEKNKLINETSLKIQSNKNINNRITQLNKWQDELIQDIEAISNNNTEFDDLIAETNNRVEELNSIVSDISKQLGILDIVKFVISEEGVKSYIVNKLLELLNNKLYYYLKKLDSNSVCVFDEYFEEQIVNDKNKICSYFNFSGAERKSIDLACLFAFSDIRRMQGGVSYNIAIYDELFDSSFDEKGIDLITDILKERVNTLNECSIVISHRKESIKAVTGDVIFLEKENGITRRVDYLDF